MLLSYCGRQITVITR